jgi:pyruvate formate lyase activating enzyme
MNDNHHQGIQADYWRDQQDGTCECLLCPHRCRIREGHTGRCRVRATIGGAVRAISYGMISSVHSDPIEKKPLYHFHPGSTIFSVGGWGCNFACSFCQNWTISQAFRQSAMRHTPDQVIALMKEEGDIQMAYTYNEPLVGFEFVRDCSRLVRSGGGANVLVTNGYCEESPASELLPLIDALNVDIKSMDEGFYRTYCKGTLKPVLNFCRQAVKAGCHLEITNLIIPGLNDSEEGLRNLATWIRNELGPLTPLHLSAFHPDYQLQAPPTPGAVLLHAYQVCRESLPYVYVGNLPLKTGQNTDCPGCGATLVEMVGYRTRITGLNDSGCIQCGRASDVIR